MNTNLTVQHREMLPSPQTLDEAMKLATVLAQSNMLPKQFQEKPENVLVAMMWSHNLNIPAIQGMQYIAVVNGRPSLYGDGLLAVCLNSGLVQDIKEEFQKDAEGNVVAICTVTRQGKPTPVVGTFSVNDAKRAGLWGKTGPWTQYPKRMLKMRARSFALRDAFPDVLSGMASAEEMEDVIEVRPSAPTAPVDAPAQAEITEPRKMPRRRKAKAEEQPAEVAPVPKPEQVQPEPVAEAAPAPEQVEPVVEEAAEPEAPAQESPEHEILAKLAQITTEDERKKLWFETPAELRALASVRQAFSDAYKRFAE
jgi:hypothetical protein